jgi:hypothetical protein
MLSRIYLILCDESSRDAKGAKMLDSLMRINFEASGDAPAAALARAAGAIARLDHALTSHPLLPAILHRARLDAVRRAAAIDGHAIDPWHLAAVLEGLRLRMDPYLSIFERGTILDAARQALDQYQWLVMPDFDQEGDIQAAEKIFAAAPGGTPLVAGAASLHAWIDQGGDRRPGRAALIRFWTRTHLLRVPFPLIGAAALRAGQPWEMTDWLPVFLHALADEAEHGLQTMMTLERAWFTARGRAGGQRRTSRAAMAIDVMAATPLVSASSLSRALGMAVNNAGLLLDRFCAEGFAIEVTHRSKRRLFGLAGLTPLREVVRPPYRPDPGRGRGRPRLIEEAEEVAVAAPAPVPLSAIERRSIDYGGLEAAMALADEAVRNARRVLGNLKSTSYPVAHGDADIG